MVLSAIKSVKYFACASIFIFAFALYQPVLADADRPSARPSPSTANLYTGYKTKPRLVARADVLKISKTAYSIRECLDVYNTDYVNPLIITAISADTWRGHKRFSTGESWFETDEPIIIKPGKCRRVAEKKRIVTGRLVYGWWVRWIRFNVSTNMGEFSSNFVSSPFKRPGTVENEVNQSGTITQSEPMGLTRAQQGQ